MDVAFDAVDFPVARLLLKRGVDPLERPTGVAPESFAHPAQVCLGWVVAASGGLQINLLYYKTLGKLTWEGVFSELIVRSTTYHISADSACHGE